MINVGKLNKRITIQKCTVTYDALRNSIKTWEDECTVWANVNGLYGEEYWAAAQQKQENTIVFTIRWFNTIDSLNLTKYRILFNGTAYDIKNIDNIEFKNRFVKIKAVAKV